MKEKTIDKKVKEKVKESLNRNIFEALDLLTHGPTNENEQILKICTTKLIEEISSSLGHHHPSVYRSCRNSHQQTMDSDSRMVTEDDK